MLCCLLAQNVQTSDPDVAVITVCEKCMCRLCRACIKTGHSYKIKDKTINPLGPRPATTLYYEIPCEGK